MSVIRYSPEAEDDLAEIKKYIAEQLFSPIAAANTVGKITRRIRRLEQFPELGTLLSCVTNIVTDYRFLVCDNYLAFYRVDGKNVRVIRILYGKRDYVSILFEELPTDEIES